MGNIDGRSQRALQVLMAIRDALTVIEGFESEGAPPEPSTPSERARWAAYKIQVFLSALSSLKSLAKVLPRGGVMGDEIDAVAAHIQEVASARNVVYIRNWLRDRGVSWREMLRPQPDYASHSWADLLALFEHVV